MIEIPREQLNLSLLFLSGLVVPEMRNNDTLRGAVSTQLAALRAEIRRDMPQCDGEWPCKRSKGKHLSYKNDVDDASVEPRGGAGAEKPTAPNSCMGLGLDGNGSAYGEDGNDDDDGNCDGGDGEDNGGERSERKSTDSCQKPLFHR